MENDVNTAAAGKGRAREDSLLDRETRATSKTASVDIDQMTDAVSEKASDLERLVLDEIRDRPMRALAWAAAAGFILGIWAAR